MPGGTLGGGHCGSNVILELHASLSAAGRLILKACPGCEVGPGGGPPGALQRRAVSIKFAQRLAAHMPLSGTNSAASDAASQGASSSPATTEAERSRTTGGWRRRSVVAHALTRLTPLGPGVPLGAAPRPTGILSLDRTQLLRSLVIRGGCWRPRWRRRTTPPLYEPPKQIIEGGYVCYCGPT